MSAPALCRTCEQAPAMRGWHEVPADEQALYDHAAHGPTLCIGCWLFAQRMPARLATRQTHDALDALARPASAYLRWPFPSLDALTGPLAPGSVHYVAGASGGGKTTFVTSAIRGWVDAGTRVVVLPLEDAPRSWRARMACVAVGVAPGDALSGTLTIRAEEGDQQAAAALDSARASLRAMLREDQEHGRLAVYPDRHVTAAALSKVCAVAKQHGTQIVVVDHVDHVGGGEDGAPTNALAESQRVNNALLDLAKRHDLVIIAMSQLNASRMRGARDRLAKYAAPQAADLYLHTFKEQNAASILGLFRPLAPDADADQLARARSGDVEPQTVLAPGVMGVSAIKLRHYGSREGQRTYLTVARGAARERTPDEVRDWEAGTQGIRTGDDTQPGRAARLGIVRGNAA